MRTGVIITALVAALAGAPSAHADLGLGFKLPPGVAAQVKAAQAGGGATVVSSSATATAGGPGGPSVSRATSSCTATSLTPTFAKLSRGYAKAIDGVVKTVCAKDWDGTFEGAAEGLKTFTIPVGEVLAKTQAACKTTEQGKATAQGCANVNVSAGDFAAAFADLHVKETAAAFKRHCKCASKGKFDFGDLKTFRALVADAYKNAEINICASGNQAVSEKAFVECVATIIGRTFAFSAAKASTAAGCFPGSSNKEKRKLFESRTAKLTLDCKPTKTSSTGGKAAKKPPAKKPPAKKPPAKKPPAKKPPTKKPPTKKPPTKPPAKKPPTKKPVTKKTSATKKTPNDGTVGVSLSQTVSGGGMTSASGTATVVEDGVTTQVSRSASLP